MSLGRLWRTTRHLGAEQLAFQLERRARRRLVRIFPGVARSRVERRAAALPVPDLDAPALRAVAETVAESHGETRDDIAAGRFTLMNRAFDFGAPDRIDWRGDFGDGDTPLRRMTLSYMAAAVPALAGGGWSGFFPTPRGAASSAARRRCRCRTSTPRRSARSPRRWRRCTARPRTTSLPGGSR